ncbi:MAG: UDP-glucose/GDP-mannose dehydrogenase family protein [bacterium]|nr:UDP-glucose/GDP-mannose dehydrogenase family protein [bacterium]
MTHLGLCSGVAAAELGFDVVAFDPDPAAIADLKRGAPPVREPSLTELMRSNATRLRFTSKAADLAICQVVVVAPDVPTDDQGRSDLSGIDALLSEVEANTPSETTRVVLSQVTPGFTRPRQRQAPLYYQVETLIFGRAMERALHPERLIVGCADPDAPLPAAYESFLRAFDCKILPMRYESAELAKIAINACLVSSISTANTLAEICEQIGAHWSEIVPALRLDARIGPHSYLEPGLGIAGGNLERDLATICALGEKAGTDTGVVRAWLANSRHRRDWALRSLHRHVLVGLENPQLAVWGLAYKRDTKSTKNSPSLALLEALPQVNARVFDPAVPASAAMPLDLEQADSALDACEGADALAIMTPWPEFTDIDPKQIASRLRGRFVLDPYRTLDAERCSDAGLEYCTLGEPDSEAAGPPLRLKNLDPTR